MILWLKFGRRGECKVCASSSSWNHVLHQSFSERENKGVPAANAKWALWFPSTFVPHVFNSLRRRRECRAGFGDAWFRHSDYINSSFTNTKSLPCAGHRAQHCVCRTSLTPHSSHLKKSQSKGLAQCIAMPPGSKSRSVLTPALLFLWHVSVPSKVQREPTRAGQPWTGSCCNPKLSGISPIFQKLFQSWCPSLWLMLCICEIMPDQAGLELFPFRNWAPWLESWKGYDPFKSYLLSRHTTSNLVSKSSNLTSANNWKCYARVWKVPEAAMLCFISLFCLPLAKFFLAISGHLFSSPHDNYWSK